MHKFSNHLFYLYFIVLKNRDDEDESCIEIDNIPVSVSHWSPKKLAEETVSFFSSHTPFSTDVSLDIVVRHYALLRRIYLSFMSIALSFIF